MTLLENRLQKIISNWFYTEPLLFSAACTHSLVENPSISIPMRTGAFRIEYNQSLLQNAPDSLLEDYLKIEVFRILLLHPYARQPYGAKKSILLMASDVTIAQMHKLPDSVVLAGVEYMKSRDSAYARAFQTAGKVFTYEDLSFEEWYKKLYKLISASKNGEAAGSDSQAEGFMAIAEESAELWEENEAAENKIKNELQKAEVDQGWGGIGGDLQRTLQQETDFSFDYRKVLTQFRQSIVSANRSLTRMRPSRRYGFKAMGSRYERKANVIIAVDVSGSITDESFSHFCHAINNFFFLGIIENIDLIFFDTNLKNTKPVSFKKKVQLDDIKGRGGTNFQPAFDFYSQHSAEYNGMIVFTDGEGELPFFKGRGNILWILDSRLAYEKNRSKLESINCCKCTYLPF